MNEGGIAPHLTTEWMIKMAKITYTATTLAAEIDTTPKELRKFLRTPDSGVAPVGKGARYQIPLTATQLGALKKKFNAWSEGVAKARAEREQMLSDAAAKKINVLTIATPASEGVKTDDATPEDDELDIDGMSDGEIEKMLDELATEGLDTDDEIEA